MKRYALLCSQDAKRASVSAGGERAGRARGGKEGKGKGGLTGQRYCLSRFLPDAESWPSAPALARAGAWRGAWRVLKRPDLDLSVRAGPEAGARPKKAGGRASTGEGEGEGAGWARAGGGSARGIVGRVVGGVGVVVAVVDVDGGVWGRG